MDNLWQAFAALGALFAAVFAAVSAFLSKRAIKSSQHASEGSLVATLMKEFWTPQFQEACRELHKQKTIYGNSYGAQYKKLWDKRDRFTADESAIFYKWDSARRTVKAYFRTVQQLAEGNYVSDKAARELLCPPHRRRELLFDLVHPLEKETNRKQDVFEYFE